MSAMDRETRFKVRGMKCGGCAARARGAVSKLRGVVDVTVDPKGGTAVVKGAVDPKAVIEALSKAGYGAALENG